MNQEKIGKFIAKKRKSKSLTQKQLVEKLGVSINAVSKWERGLCLMDLSLLKPLSQILGVTINEILSGEEIKNEDIENAEDPSTAGVDTGTTEGKMAETSGNAHDTYVIRPGDTLYQISIEKYGSMDVIREICELNGIAENQIIYPGQVIVLP